MSPIHSIAVVPRWMPPSVASALGAARGWLAYRTRGSERRRVDASLQQAFGDLEPRRRQQLCRDTFIAGGRAASELGVARRWQAQRLCRHLDLQEWRRLVEAENRGRGVVVVVPPLAYGPLIPLAISLYRGSVAAMGSFGSNSNLQTWAQRLAPESLWTGIDDPDDALSILNRGGRVVAPSSLSPAIAHMAHEAGAPLVPVFAEPATNPSMFRIVVKEPIDPHGQTLAELTQQALRAVEPEIRRQPQLWSWGSEEDTLL